MPPLPTTDKPAPTRPPRASRPLSQQSSSQVVSTSPSSPPGLRMALASSPSESSPLGLSRPAAPRIRSKRLSATPSPRMSPSPRPQTLESPSSKSSSGRATPECYTGTLTERTEDELLRASREALQDGLRKEWAEREKHLTRINELDAAQRTSDEQSAELVKARDGLQNKFDAVMNEQSMLESELEAANSVIDTLRRRCADAERQVAQGQRRYADQEKAFEAERQVHQADQLHLHHRIKSLSTEHNVRASHDETNAALQEELFTLTASHRTLVAQLTTLADEMHEVKAENGRLQDENDSWQLLIEERTLAGTMRGGLLSPPDGSASPSGRSTTPSSIRRQEPNALETLEEQLEMDELHSELDSQQPIFDESDRAHLSRVGSNGSYMSPGANTVELGSPIRVNTSLAMELGVGLSAAEVEPLRNQIKSLKESNKALTLYCSKILDRIIAQEGFEHVLSVDYKTRRFGTRRGGAAPRPTIEELAKSMEANGPPPLPPPPEALPASAPRRKARPQSMLLPASSAVVLPPPAPRPALDEAKPPAAPPAQTAEQKRARRGFSIDFRSLGFGSTEPKVDPKDARPQLKPLQLASRATLPSAGGPSSTPSMTGPSAANTTPPATVPNSSPPLASLSTFAKLTAPAPAAARKLEPQEEDEEDRRERHRMEATLKLMGIERPAESSPPAPPPQPLESAEATPSGPTSWFARRLSRTPQAAAAPAPTLKSPSPPADRSSTPLGRLSAALGGPNGTADLPMDDPAATAAALREYDAREREQARRLAEGRQGSATYTLPPRVSRSNSKRASGSVSSGSSVKSGSVESNSVNSANGVNGVNGANGNDEGTAEKRHTHTAGQGSVSTLWSMGSSRTSVEVERVEGA